MTAVFVHHTDSPNGYDCADAPKIIRYLYAGQAGVRHWDDIGYNFLVDRCGTIYEGRAGGIDRAVVGAHTQGFNVGTAGIAAIGTFTAGVPVPKAMTDAIAAVAAWKLGLVGIDPGLGAARLHQQPEQVPGRHPRDLHRRLRPHRRLLDCLPGRRPDGQAARDQGTRGPPPGQALGARAPSSGSRPPRGSP